MRRRAIEPDLLRFWVNLLPDVLRRRGYDIGVEELRLRIKDDKGKVHRIEFRKVDVEEGDDQCLKFWQ